MSPMRGYQDSVPTVKIVTNLQAFAQDIRSRSQKHGYFRCENKWKADRR
jgi:hypothetical protein